MRFITANYKKTKQAGKNNGLISDSDGRSACAQPAANAILGEFPRIDKPRKYRQTAFEDRGGKGRAP